MANLITRPFFRLQRKSNRAKSHRNYEWFCSLCLFLFVVFCLICLVCYILVAIFFVVSFLCYLWLSAFFRCVLFTVFVLCSMCRSESSFRSGLAKLTFCSVFFRQRPIKNRPSLSNWIDQFSETDIQMVVIEKSCTKWLPFHRSQNLWKRFA